MVTKTDLIQEDSSISAEGRLKTQVDAAWDKMIAENGGIFTFGKLYPIEVTINGKTIKFGMSKQSSNGPKRLSMIFQTKYGPQLNHFKMGKCGDLESTGSKNLWAMSGEARQAHLDEFNSMFTAESTSEFLD